MIKYIVGLSISAISVYASMYAINIGFYNRIESGQKVIKELKSLDEINSEKLTLFPRENGEKSFLLRSQNFDTYVEAKNEKNIIQRIVPDVFIIKREDDEQEVKVEDKIENNVEIEKSEAKESIAVEPIKVVSAGIGGEDETIYKSAVENFNTKNYEKSYELLSKIFLRHLSDENLNFYLGRSAFELKMYDVALSVFERILIAHPNNLRTRLESARTLFHLKSFKDSKKEFASIAKLELSNNVRANVERYLALLEKLTQKKTLTGMFMGGVSYDSNANNGALQSSYFLPLINDTLPGTAKESDTAHQEVVMLNHIYALGSSQFALKNSVMAFAKTMTDQTDKNVVLVGWTPSLMYKKKNLSAELGFGYNTMWFGSDSYLSTLTFNPKFNYVLNKTLSLNGQYRWQKKENEIATNSQRDSTVSGMRIGLNKKFPYGMSVSANYGFDIERRIRGARTDVNQDIRTLTVAMTKSWDKTLSFNLGYNFRNPMYKEIDQSFFTKREDESSTYSLGFTKKLQKTLIVNGKYSKVKNLSNQGPFSYEKDMVGLNIIKLFI